MVLAVMVAILVFRVYQVLNPLEIETGPNFRIPGPNPPEGIGPGLPPSPPPREPTDDWSRLWRRTIWRWDAQRGGGGGPGDGQGQAEERLEISLLDLREVNGTWRARIQTQSRATWRELGEQFEQYTLMEIDADQGCVTIFSDRLQRNVPLCIAAPATP